MLRQNFGLLLGHQYAGHRMSEIGHSRRSRSNLRMTQFSLKPSRRRSVLQRLRPVAREVLTAVVGPGAGLLVPK